MVGTRNAFKPADYVNYLLFGREGVLYVALDQSDCKHPFCSTCQCSIADCRLTIVVTISSLNIVIWWCYALSKLADLSSYVSPRDRCHG